MEVAPARVAYKSAGAGWRIPGDVEEVLRILAGCGHRAYLVGGCVRDLLLGIKPQDYDVATDAVPEEVLRIFGKLGWVTVPKGIEYGVVFVVHPRTRREVEVATFRKEFYAEDFNRRSTTVEFATSLREDVQRRDFTINALAMDLKGNVIDCVGGLRDLERRVIRFVGNPGERIREDPLRMLRALRFASKLGFSIDPASFRAIKEGAGLIRYVSWERIGDEVVKAAGTPRFALFAGLLWVSGLYRHVLPELEAMARTAHGAGGHHKGETVLEHTLEVLGRLDRMGADVVTKLAGLLHDAGKPAVAEVADGKVSFHKHEAVSAQIAEEVLRRWRRPLKLVTAVKEVVKFHMVPHSMLACGSGAEKIASRLVGRHGPHAVRILMLAMADAPEHRDVYGEALRLAKEMLSMPKPLVNGKDVMELYGLKPGPKVGEVKQALYELQLRHGLRSKEEVVRVACRELGICPGRR